MNPELPALGNPAEILSDLTLARDTSRQKENARIVAWLDAAAVAIPALYRIAATGNVAAKAACVEIHAILRRKP